MMNEKWFNVIKDNSVPANIVRGAIIEEKALIGALEKNLLALF